MRKLSPRRGTALLVLSAVLIAASAPVQARRSTASVFTAVDTDKDGTVDEAEARQAAAALFDRLDTDKDGTLDTNELRGHLGKEELQANDPDNDGTLTKDELLGRRRTALQSCRCQSRWEAQNRRIRVRARCSSCEADHVSGRRRRTAAETRLAKEGDTRRTEILTARGAT
jgi:hypothetical protein